MTDDTDETDDPFDTTGPEGETTPLDRMEVLENIPSDGISEETLVRRVDANEGLVESVIAELRASNEIRMEDGRVYKQ